MTAMIEKSGKNYRGKYRDWLTATGFFIIGALFRLWHLGTPKGFIFDEVYYAKNAHSLLLHGVEMDAKGAAEFIVHPSVGKWLIAIGIKIFGFNEFGWRFSSAIIGSLSIALIYFVAKRLFNNYLISCLAAVLTLADGLHLVHSRTALLDLFLMFFVLLAFLFILKSQHWAAGMALGLAASTKWSGLYYMLAFLLFVIYADYRQNRALEIENSLLVTLKGSWIRFLQFVLLPVAIYIGSWGGWLISARGYDRKWGRSRFLSLWHYHAEILNFHRSLTDKHPYSANPWSWLIQGRPTSFFYSTSKGCGSTGCSQEVLALGTPLLWWSATIAIAVTFGYWISRREWQSGLLLLSVAAGYLPWFFLQKRTTFSFYSIVFEPFLILIICYVIVKFLEPDSHGNLPQQRLYAIYGYVALVIVNFIYFLPLYMGTVISYSSWLSRMWFPSWI